MTNFPKIIREWYFQHGRRLPWRETKDPYKIWISEIILQQTRVDQGLAYYHRFIKAFPNVKALADAHETRLMQLWQGLGYYSRARNLHHAAQSIVNEHNGTMPQTYEKIKTLKGIGPYTSAAIASFAFGLPHAVVDGNVYRVLSRYFAKSIAIDSGEGKKFFNSLANNLLDKKDPATHNQAIMDLGAMVCKPANPNCFECPLHQSCAAYATGTQTEYPVKTKRIKKKKRYLHFLIVKNNTHILTERRNNKDIWEGLFQFPLIETPKLTENHEITKMASSLFKTSITTKEILRKKHQLTHQELHATFYNTEIPKESNLAELVNTTSYDITPVNKLHEVPFPQLIQKNLDELLNPT